LRGCLVKRGDRYNSETKSKIEGRKKFEKGRKKWGVRQRVSGSQDCRWKKLITMIRRRGLQERNPEDPKSSRGNKAQEKTRPRERQTNVSSTTRYRNQRRGKKRTSEKRGELHARNTR